MWRIVTVNWVSGFNAAILKCRFQMFKSGWLNKRCKKKEISFQSTFHIITHREMDELYFSIQIRGLELLQYTIISPTQNPIALATLKLCSNFDIISKNKKKEKTNKLARWFKDSIQCLRKRISAKTNEIWWNDKNTTQFMWKATWKKVNKICEKMYVCMRFVHSFMSEMMSFISIHRFRFFDAKEKRIFKLESFSKKVMRHRKRNY